MHIFGITNIAGTKQVHLEIFEFPRSSQQLKYNLHYTYLALTMKKKTIFFLLVKINHTRLGRTCRDQS